MALAGTESLGSMGYMGRFPGKEGQREACETGSPGCRSSGECPSHGCTALAIVSSIVVLRMVVYLLGGWWWWWWWPRMNLKCNL